MSEGSPFYCFDASIRSGYCISQCKWCETQDLKAKILFKIIVPKQSTRSAEEAV